MKKIITLAIVLGALGAIYFIMDPLQGDLTAMKKNQYIESTITKLKNFNPSTVKPLETGSKGEYYAFDGDGDSFLKLKDGSWIYVISRTIHADTDFERMIGDIQLAVDNSGTIYKGTEHWCGAKLVESKNIEGTSIENLLKTLNLTKQ